MSTASSPSPAVQAAALSFIEARLNPHVPIGTPIDGIDNLDDAYAVQKEMVRIGPGLGLGAVVGWKCGATNAAAQAGLQFSKPFFGPLFQSCLVPNTGKVSLRSMGAFRASEAEFCFHLAEACPAKGSPYTEKEIWDKVATVAPAIEIAATRCTHLPLKSTTVVGDFALNGCVVVGHRIPAESIVGGWESLARVVAAVKLNGVSLASESGANVLGNPITSLTWLANTLNEYGLQLNSGDLVMSGAASASKNALASGDTLDAVFTGFCSGISDQVSSVKITE